MSTGKTVQELNEELAQKIHEEARRDPHSPYAYKCLAIANGQVVAVADDFDELMCHLDQVKPNPEQCYWVRIDPEKELNADNEIWGLG